MFLIFALLLIMIPVYSLAETLPTKINAENLEFKSGVYSGSGGVRISQKERMLSASTMVFDNNTGDVTAYGNVVFTEGNNILSSESLMFNINTNYMRIDNGKIFIRDDNYHIEGDTIEGFSNERFRIESGIFSTCDGEPQRYVSTILMIRPCIKI
jgi:LPS-assembly protein